MKREDLDEYLLSLDLSAYIFADLDDAIIGWVWVEHQISVVYNANKIVQVFIDRDGMTHDEAREFYEYNTVRSIEQQS